MTAFILICMVLVVVGLMLTIAPNFYIKYPWVFTTLFFLATILVIVYANTFA